MNANERQLKRHSMRQAAPSAPIIVFNQKFAFICGLLKYRKTGKRRYMHQFDGQVTRSDDD
jgi:hypothetical protein